MKKITGTKAKNIKKEADVLDGDPGSLQSNYTSARNETTCPSSGSLWPNNSSECCLAALRERRQPWSSRYHKTLPLYL